MYFKQDAFIPGKDKQAEAIVIKALFRDQP
jgi:hypothetical protein